MKSLLLAAIDSSAAARPVLEWAEIFARSIGCSVQALHVAEDGDDAAATFAAAAEIPLRTMTGDVIVCLGRAAEDPGVVAIVLGGRGLPGGPRPTGHIALHVITHVLKPVIVVPPMRQSLLSSAGRSSPSRAHRVGDGYRSPYSSSSQAPASRSRPFTSTTTTARCLHTRTRSSTRPRSLRTSSSPGTSPPASTSISPYGSGNPDGSSSRRLTSRPRT